MNMKKFFLLLIILIILANITSINATENNTATLEQNNNYNTNITEDISISDINKDKINEEILNSENTDETPLTEGGTPIGPPDSSNWDSIRPELYNTQLSLTINDTSSVNTTKNVTFNILLEWDLYMSPEYYNKAKILIYENNTAIHTFQMSDLSGEYVHNAHDIKGITFQYHIKDMTEIKAILKTGSSISEGFELESTRFSFEELKNIAFTNLKNNTLIINNNNFSNENWTNQLKYLKKAIEEAPENSVIYLNNIEFLNDENLTITIDKNLTIIGNNATINGLDCGTIFAINPQTTLNLINLTFTNTMANYIIKNNGKVKITNTIFKNNPGKLISNYGDLTLENCKIENITSIYYALSFNKIDTLENGLIYNAKMLTLINTTFNNISLHPFTVNKKIKWDGIIVNDNKTLIIDSYFTNMNYRLIYNNGLIEINNTIMENITSTITSYTYQYSQQLNYNLSYFAYSAEKTSIEGSCIYNNNQCIIFNTIFQNINQAIFNDNLLLMKNCTLTQSSLNNNGTFTIKDAPVIQSEIINSGNFTVDNSTMKKTTILNNETMLINNTLITEYEIGENESAVINNGIMTVNNTSISECRIAEYGNIVSNNGIMTMTHSQILNNNGRKFYSCMILNNEIGNFTLEKTLIKENTIPIGTREGSLGYLGVIRNKGTMEITGCIFDNNTANDWDSMQNGDGGINIYNTGKINVMYNYLLNTEYYTLPDYDPGIWVRATPTCFLFNYGGTCNINYNFFCLSPDKVIHRADVNYYFVPSFEEDYYPIKLNQNANITLTLKLTNGTDNMDFNDWDKLLTLGLNTTITTIDENGEYINITLILKDHYTFNFNYTGIKEGYFIYANILNYKTNAFVEVGKEFANMDVAYSNVTYKENMTFHIKVCGNITTPTGNITFTLNKQKYIVNLSDGECDFTIPSNLTPDNYTIKIEYDGDDEYFKILKKYYEFTIFKITPTLNVTAPEVKYKETGIITITLTPDTARLYGKLYINGDLNNDRLVVQNTITLEYTPSVGVYNITVVLEGDKYYNGCSASTLFVVSKWPTNLTVEAEDIKYGENATINITISPGTITGKATLEINGVNQTIALKNTVTQITVTGLQAGTYHVTVYYPGTKFQYLPSNASTTFSVEKITSHMTVNVTTNPDLTGNITVTTNYPDCTGEVGIYINNDDIKILNLTDGSCTFQVKFKRGNNYIYIQYNGDTIYSMSTWNTTMYIEGKAIITQENMTFAEQETNYYKINLTDTDGNPYEYTQISVTFQNQTYTLTTDSHGIAYLPIKTIAGTYAITTTYKNATKTNTITVTPAKMNITIKDILAGETETITVTLPANATGNISLTIDNIPYERTLVNGTCKVEILDLNLGEHNLTITYSGDGNYTNQTKTLTFHIKNSISWIRVTAADATYGETVTVTATVITGATGSVTFTLHNQTQTANLTGNQATATFNNIPAGNKTVTAHYNGDGTYQGSDNSTTVNIGKAIPSINVNTTDLNNGENVWITAFVNPDATGNVTFHIEGLYSPRNRTITSGKAEWYIEPLKPGIYILNVKYNGDANYENISAQKMLVVSNIPAEMNVTVKDILAGETETITVTLPHDAGGNITLTVDNSTYNKTVVNGSCSIDIPGLGLGEHNLTVAYSGDDFYANQTKTLTFHIKNSLSWITLKAANATYGETVTVSATVISGATGSITFTVDGQTQTVNLTNNQATAAFSKISAGNKVITARYNGDSIYLHSDAKAEITIGKAASVMEIITSNMTLNDNLLITVVLNPDATGNVTFRILELYSARNRTIVNGNASWLIEPLKTGSYILTAAYNGDSNHLPVSAQITLVQNQVETRLAVQIPVVNADDDLIAYATLTDIDNNKITGEVILEIAGEHYKISVENGAGSINLGEFKSGTYNYTAAFTGNGNYSIATTSGTFKIIANSYRITGNANIVQYYGTTKTYKIRLLNNNNPVKGAIVTVKINKDTVQVKTDKNGYATLKLSLKTGKYTITSTYKNVKVSNKITVKPTLITKNKKIKKGKTLTYTAKLLNKNGKALKNKKITFKIKGKKYKAKTNKKGVAKIKVKKLKAGKYKIITTYGKQKNTNTITVKK